MKRSRKVVYRRAVRREEGTVADCQRWYAIQIQPQLRETAAFNLLNQGFSAFSPRIAIQKSRKTSIVEPMFRGYCFVLLNLMADKWSSINGTRGVIGLLPKHALYPTPMPEGLIEKLIETDPTPESEFIGIFEEYFPGITKVQVVDDHRLLAGRTGLVTDVRSNLLQVSFSMDSSDGKGIPVWLDRDELKVVT